MVFWKYHGIFKTTVPRESFMNRNCYIFCKIGKFTFSKASTWLARCTNVFGEIKVYL